MTAPVPAAVVPDGGTVAVGVLGRGAIGGVVARALEAGAVPGAHLAGVVGRDGDAGDLVARSGVVVECAGHEALAEVGPGVIASGRTLVALSVGVLADERVARALEGGPGRLVVPPGAVGGLEPLRAAAAAGVVSRVTLTSVKRPSAVGADTDRPAVLYSGDARTAALRFPRTANVAAVVARAAGGWDRVRVRVVVDPAVARTTHTVEAETGLGHVRCVVANHPSPANPATSAVVAWSTLVALADLLGSRAVPGPAPGARAWGTPPNGSSTEGC